MKPLTVEEELPGDIALAVSTRIGQVALGVWVLDGLLVQAITGELRDARHVHGAEVLVPDQDLSPC